MPPVKQNKALFKSIKRPVHIANFDVVLMCVCKNQAISKKVETNAQFKELKDMFESNLSHNITIAKNIRKAGESHVHSQFTQGKYLFNYFDVEEIILYTIESLVSLDPQFLLLLLRNFTVAKVDSIGFVVLICTQCFAEKS